MTTFPLGPPRSRAMGVYAAMSVGGGAAGLLAGGLLVTVVPLVTAIAAIAAIRIRRADLAGG